MSPFSWQLYVLGRRDLPYFETFLLGRDLSASISWFLPEDHPLWRGVLLSPGIGPGTDRWGWVPQPRVPDPPDRVLEGTEVHRGCVRSSWREEEGVEGRTTWLLWGVVTGLVTVYHHFWSHFFTAGQLPWTYWGRTWQCPQFFFSSESSSRSVNERTLRFEMFFLMTRVWCWSSYIGKLSLISAGFFSPKFAQHQRMNLPDSWV